MATLADALAWAARGFKIFPLVALGKTPAVAAFQYVATTDPLVITAWWRDPVTSTEYDFNIGVSTNDLVVVDVDLKEGKPGLASYHELGGHFDTLVVQTPTGGYHCYFHGPDSRLMVGLRPGVDIRSHNGYVVGPGSYVIDPVKGVSGEYTIFVDEKIDFVPIAIENELRLPNERRARDDDVRADTPTAIAQAIAWLTDTAPAVEGQGGDNTTFQVAAKLVRDYALSLETTFSLLVQHWNVRCNPPWDSAELWRKIENAEAYASGPSGAARAEAFFGDVQLPAIPKAIIRQAGVYMGNAYDLIDIPPRPWLIERLLLTGYLTMLVAAGGAGKSLTGLVMAAHLALGRDIGEYHVRYPTKSIVFNAEDDVMEQSRRLFAICKAYEMDYNTVRSRITLISREEFPILLATDVEGQAILNEPHLTELIRLASPPDVGFVVLDPLVEVHGCDENDPIEMRFVMGLLTRIAREANVALFITHHTTKSSSSPMNARAGNIETARGTSAITNAARVGLTLYRATMEDLRNLGVAVAERHAYLRLDDGKQNLAAMNPYGTWFRWQSVDLGNGGAFGVHGDRVGVYVPVDLKDAQNEQRVDMAFHLREAIIAAGMGGISLHAATLYMQAQNDLYGKQSQATVRRTIEKMFTLPMRIEDDTLVIQRVTVGNKDTILITLT